MSALFLLSVRTHNTHHNFVKSIRNGKAYNTDDRKGFTKMKYIIDITKALRSPNKISEGNAIGH